MPTQVAELSVRFSATTDSFAQANRLVQDGLRATGALADTTSRGLVGVGVALAANAETHNRFLRVIMPKGVRDVEIDESSIKPRL